MPTSISQQIKQLLDAFSWIFLAAVLQFTALVTLDSINYYLALSGIGVLHWLYARYRYEWLLPPVDIWKIWLAPLLFLCFWALFLFIYHHGIDDIDSWEFKLFLSYLLAPIITLAFWGARKNWVWLPRIIVLVALYTLPYNVAVCIFQPERGVGTLSVPIIRGDIAMLLGLLSITTLFLMERAVWSWLAVLGFIGGVFLSIQTGSRGGWLAFFTVVPVLWWLLKQHAPIRLPQLYVALIGLILLVGVACPDNPFFERIAVTVRNLLGYFTEDHYQTSLGWRLVMWKAALWGYLEKPWLGWGFGHFREVFDAYVAYSGIEGPKGIYFHRPHNEYLQFFVEGGTLGGMLYLMMYILPGLYLLNLFMYFRRQLDLNGMGLALLGLFTIESMGEFAITFLNLMDVSTGLLYVTLMSAILIAVVYYRQSCDG